jgi:nucleoside-diphosphate-sugar epimerase
VQPAYGRAEQVARRRDGRSRWRARSGDRRGQVRRIAPDRDLAADPALSGCVRLYDNLQRETYSTLLDLPAGDRYQFVEGDILDNLGVRRALEDVWAVVHMAAIVHTLSFGNPLGWIERVNHWGVTWLTRQRGGRGVFIYTSSASV